MEKVKINCKKCGVDNRFSAATPEELAQIKGACISCGMPLKLPNAEDLIRWKERSRQKENRRQGFSRLLVCSFFYLVMVGLQALLAVNPSASGASGRTMMAWICGALVIGASVMILLAAQGLYRFLSFRKENDADNEIPEKAHRWKNIALAFLVAMLLIGIPVWIFHYHFYDILFAASL